MPFYRGQIVNMEEAEEIYLVGGTTSASQGARQTARFKDGGWAMVMPTKTLKCVNVMITHQHTIAG